MLKTLSISNYALIENLEITFPDGLIIITGETGAGKSILLGAISLLLGAKSDPNVFKNSDKSCVVEALFDVKQDLILHQIFSKEEIELTSQLTLRRVISPNGKSRSFVNDNPVSIQFLKELSEKIIDIHAQHQHLLLSDNNFQLSALDSFCKNELILENYQLKFNELNSLRSEHKEKSGKIAKAEAEFEYNNYLLKQLIDAKLSDGELEELEQEFKLLSNAEEIKSTLVGVNELLSPLGISTVQNLREAISLIHKISDTYPAVSCIAERLEVCRIELKDIENEIVIKADSINILPERIVEIEERLSLIYNLLKRHKVDAVKDLIDIRESLSQKQSDSEGLKEELEKVSIDLANCQIERDKLAADLDHTRRENSQAFAKEILGKIVELEMPHAVFDVEVHSSENYNLTGNNTITFLFSANKNVATRELSKVASGGELSRIMLCLKAIMAKNSGMPSLIFDEIDTGVSGSIADKMGNLIDELSVNMQVFAITHLPQIASKGSNHLLVYKEMDNTNTTRTFIKQIRGEDREREIARMLSGSSLTSAAFANAKELLGTNRN